MDSYEQLISFTQERGFPDINIISEKVAVEGVTRFEDRDRLPLGITFNIASYGAKLLWQCAYNPQVSSALSVLAGGQCLNIVSACGA